MSSESIGRMVFGKATVKSIEQNYLPNVRKAFVNVKLKVNKTQT